MKKMKRSAACVAILVCLTAPALGSTWTGSSGLLWSNGDNWNPAGVPDGVDAIINNGLLGSPTLNSVSNIINLEVSGYSTLNIDPGAGLTASGSGNIAVGGASDEGYVYQTGGAVSFGSDLTLGNGASDFGRWWMTSGGSLAVANDLTVGGSGAAEFELRDTSSLTVGGSIDIAASGGSGSMTVSGGTLGQLAGGGDPAILADLTVGGGGTLQVEGNATAINVINYEQSTSGALNLVLDNAGIATINASGNVTLSGALNVSIASGASPAPGIYNIIVGQGVLTGGFNALDLPPDVGLSYDNDNSTIKLYVGVAPPPMDITIIDSFDQGSHEAYYPGGGGVRISSYTGPGPIGGERVLRAFNNHNNNYARVKVDATAGTCEFWGDTNAANRGVNWGTTNSPDNATSGVSELNLDLSSASALEIDFVSNIGFDYSQLYPTVYLRTNNGEPSEKDFAYGLNLNMNSDPFTISIPITAFTSGGNTITTADLEDVDGIRLYSYQNGTLIIDELRITEPASEVVVPEPAGLGLIGLALLAVRKRRS